MATTSATAGVEGECSARFLPVREAFERNFAERGELGASVCVIVDGRVEVDVWGGVADPSTGAPWARDTVSLVFSCTKGAATACALLLADRGEVDLDAPVTEYWPEFGAAGKSAITVAHLLAHQSGVAAFRELLPQGGLYDWDLCAKLLAEQEPWWEPGTRHGYHAMTFGFLVGEVVRRVSGRSLGTFFRDEFAAPFGLDFWIGTPPEVRARAAHVVMAQPTEPLPPFYEAVFSDPGGLAGHLFLNIGGWLDETEVNSEASLAAEIPAANGVANARALAGFYEALPQVISAPLLDRATRVHSASFLDAVMLSPGRFGLGFMKPVDARKIFEGSSLIAPDTAYGHAGMGGSLGMADPAKRLSFGYSMNRLGNGILLNDRGQSLVDATYRCLA